MNEVNYKGFMGLRTAAEIKTFFLLYVGLDCFLKGETIEVLSKRSFLKALPVLDLNGKDLTRSYTYRLKISGNNESDRFLLFSQPHKTFCFISIDNPTAFKFETIFHYPDKLPEDVVKLLLDVAHTQVRKDEGYKELEVLRNLDKPKGFIYRFILGAGVNSGYGMPTWAELEKRFIESVEETLDRKAFEETNKSTFNTNYGSFQIVKDIDEQAYRENLLYATFPSWMPIRTDYSTLIAVSSVIDAQTRVVERQSVLTFNFDDMLEVALKDCFNKSSEVIWRSRKEDIPTDVSITVIHPHGYLPIDEDRDLDHFASVVLTVDEYIKNYQIPSSFGYNALYSQLDSTCCFVGNSITDYEEQKVISAHFAKHPAQFHYCLCASDGIPIEARMYKTIFLMKIGIIPLWYDHHEDYIQKLKQYADDIRSHNA